MLIVYMYGIIVFGSQRCLKRRGWNIRKRQIVLLVFVWTNENGGFGIQLRHPSYSVSMHRFNLIRLDGKNRFEYATCGCVLILKRNKTSPLDKA